MIVALNVSTVVDTAGFLTGPRGLNPIIHCLPLGRHKYDVIATKCPSAYMVLCYSLFKFQPRATPHYKESSQKQQF